MYLDASGRTVPSDSTLPPAVCVGGRTSLGPHHYAAGWSTGGELLAFRSDDAGASWGPPVIADARERGADVCDRPAPAVFADTLNGFLHVAYYAEPRGGSGVYYVHSMYPEQLAQVGAGMFEQPVALTYGTRAVRTTVASRGDTVVVAYEDPNSPRGGIGAAFSTTGGHSFASRLQVSSGPATSPAAELRAGALRVYWREGMEPFRWMRRDAGFR